MFKCMSLFMAGVRSISFKWKDSAIHGSKIITPSMNGQRPLKVFFKLCPKQSGMNYLVTTACVFVCVFGQEDYFRSVW